MCRERKWSSYCVDTSSARNDLMRQPGLPGRRAPDPTVPAVTFSRRQRRLLGDCVPSRRNLLFYGLEIETRALLHRWKLDRRHRQFFHLLLNKHEAPEFVFEPVEILLGPFFGHAIGPACAFKRIEAQVGNVGYVRLGFVSQPPPGLVNETKLVVIDADGAELAF